MIKVKLINHTLISENEFRDTILLGTLEDFKIYLKNNDLEVLKGKIFCKEFGILVGFKRALTY